MGQCLKNGRYRAGCYAPGMLELKMRKDSTGEPAAMLNLLRTPVVLESILDSAMKEVGPVKSLGVGGGRLDR